MKEYIFPNCWILILFLPGIKGRYYWRDYEGEIPNDALMGAKGLYVAQVISNGLLPATFDPKTGEATTEIFLIKMSFKSGIKLLCDEDTQKFVWEFVNVNSLKNDKDLVIGGKQFDNTLYIGRIFHQGQWKIGKVFPPTSIYKGLRVWNKLNIVQVFKEFEVLKYLDKPIYDIDVRSLK